jgi:FHA domain/Cyclic nucleotide-binding domain
MLSRVTEQRLHLVRWFLAVGWLILIFSAFYDPLSLWLTDANNLWSPVHIHPEKCILVQGNCLPQTSYPLAPRIFWGIVVPAGVVILLVGGHEVWRRICPLYFISQIPRRLGWQRKKDQTNPETGTVRAELVGVHPESWLGKNFGYLQFGLFFLGLNLRLLVANGNGIGFGCFVLASVAGAVLVGYLFKGRTWCHYFCPMAPVQTFYTSNRGLMGTNAHLSPAASVTQSMCRSTDANGKEKSACVSCQSPCMDIDVERTYWTNIERPERKLLFYGYFGLMLGFFLYFYLYAGNWDYYFSGVWSHDSQQFSSLLKPGFYWGGQAIAIPKILAVPLTLGVCTLASYQAGINIERLAGWWSKRHQKNWTVIQIRHVCFILAVFVSFNVFFVFAGRPNIRLLPQPVELLFNAFYVLVSSLWLQRNLSRSKTLYQRESLTGSLRRQLQKLAVNWTEFLEGRSIEDLDTSEVYVLAKVLPGFNHQSRVQVYQGVLQEALTEGKAQSANSLELLQDMRKELQITTDEHYKILASLGVENPELLNPAVQKSREDRLRLEGYQRSLEALLLDLIASHASIEQAIQERQGQIEAMRQEYSITNDEQEQVLIELFHPNGTLLSTSVQLLQSLQMWSSRYLALTANIPPGQDALYQILQSIILDHQRPIVAKLFSILEILAEDPTSVDIATATGYMASDIVKELLPGEQERLPSFICQALLAKAHAGESCSLPGISDSLAATVLNAAAAEITELGNQPIPTSALTEVLQDLLQEVDPLVQALSLHALQQVDSHLGKTIALRFDGNASALVQETVDRVLQRPPARRKIPTLTLDLVIHTRHEQQVFTQPLIRLGRGTTNDVVILDNQVSRNHAIFKIDAQGLRLRDLGSTNGLRYGKTCLKDEEQAIPSGTKIMLCPSNDITVTAHWSIAEVPEDGITTIEKMLWLSNSKFFAPFSHQSLVELAKNGNFRLYEQGETLCHAHEPANNLILIIAGAAQSNQDRYSPGKVVGDLGMLTKSVYSQTVIASSPKVPALVIAADRFDELLEDDPGVARALLVSISQRLQAIT